MKKIGIIGTMDEEIICLKRYMKIEEMIDKAKMTFYVGAIQDKEVILVRCGTGKVSASVCTQILIDTFSVDTIISVGLAGGLSPELKIGDMIVSSDTQGEEAPHNQQYLESNEQCVALLVKEAKQVITQHQVLKGWQTSGDGFISGTCLTHNKNTSFTAYNSELEGGAIAHACYLNHIPFVIVRIISDHVNQKNELQYNEFVDVAARNISKIIAELLMKN